MSSYQRLAAGIRDFIAAADYVAAGKDGVSLELGASIIGFVPDGDIAKGIAKGATKIASDAGLDALSAPAVPQKCQFPARSAIVTLLRGRTTRKSDPSNTSALWHDMFFWTHGVGYRDWVNQATAVAEQPITFGKETRCRVLPGAWREVFTLRD